MRRDAGRRIDILRDPLIRNSILRIGDRQWLWYMAAHHIVLDGFGAMNLIERTAYLYTAMLADQAPEPCIGGSLQDLIDSDLAYRESRRFETDRAYWLDRLSEYQEPPMAARSGTAGDGKVVLLGSELPETVACSVRGATQRLAATESELFIAAFAAYRARTSGSGDVILSLPVAARTTAILRRSAGMLFPAKVPRWVR
jgi:hypothetical protein